MGLDRSAGCSQRRSPTAGRTAGRSGRSRSSNGCRRGRGWPSLGVLGYHEPAPIPGRVNRAAVPRVLALASTVVFWSGLPFVMAAGAMAGALTLTQDGTVARCRDGGARGGRRRGRCFQRSTLRRLTGRPGRRRPATDARFAIIGWSSPDHDPARLRRHRPAQSPTTAEPADPRSVPPRVSGQPCQTRRGSVCLSGYGSHDQLADLVGRHARRRRECQAKCGHATM
jgi:hypothetical protein